MAEVQLKTKTENRLLISNENNLTAEERAFFCCVEGVKANKLNQTSRGSNKWL